MSELIWHKFSDDPPVSCGMGIENAQFYLVCFNNPYGLDRFGGYDVKCWVSNRWIDFNESATKIEYYAVIPEPEAR